MLDLIIRGGEVVTPQGVAHCDIAISGETIAALAAPGALAAQPAARVRHHQLTPRFSSVTGRRSRGGSS